MGTVIVAGEVFGRMTELLELLTVHVSFNLIVPEISNLNVSEMTSVEGMELTRSSLLILISFIKPTIAKEKNLNNTDNEILSGRAVL